MIDFHTHILPGIDDGSDSAEISVTMLKQLKEQGVNSVVLTPHFYAYASSAEDFKEKKESAIKKLLDRLKETPVDIKIYSGCETLYFDELWRLEDLRDFGIGGTEYILVEMPFDSWSDNMVDGVGKIMGKGLIPVLAHFERYLKYRGNLEKIYQLAEMGVLLQMNCKFINDFMTRRKAVRFIKSGLVSVIGTDCHNPEHRAPDYGKAAAYLRTKLGNSRFEKFCIMQKHILHNARRIY